VARGVGGDKDEEDDDEDQEIATIYTSINQSIKNVYWHQRTLEHNRVTVIS